MGCSGQQLCVARGLRRSEHSGLQEPPMSVRRRTHGWQLPAQNCC